MPLKSQGVAADGNPLPMKMGYLVGWSDLRGASVLVPAGDILDYVSPYALEQFEYELWKERRREEKEAAEERSRAAERRTAPRAGGPEARAAAIKRRRRPGRPRNKKRRGPRAGLEVPVDEGAILEEARKRAGSQAREGQPSLSTPQKGRPVEFVGGGADDEAEAEMDAAIYRQLYGDGAETSYPVTSEQESRHSDSEPPRKRRKSSSPAKDAGLGAGRISDSMTPTARQTHVSGHGSSARSTPKSGENATQARTSFTPVVPPKTPLVRQDHKVGPSSGVEGNANSLSLQRPGKPPPKPKTPSKTPRKKPPGGVNTPASPRNGAGSRNKAPAKEPADAQFVLERLEGMKCLEIDGKEERFFLVRWEGNWAPEDNPTWEPEENIPPALVKRYLKNPRRTAQGAPAPTKNAWPTRRYSTVMEAFEDSGLAEGGVNEVPDSNDEGEDEDDEMFQVTEGMGEEGGAGFKPSSEFLSRELSLAFGRGF